jgi:hypothetical protein
MALLEWTHSTILGSARQYLLLVHHRLVDQFVKTLGYRPDPALPLRYNEKLLWRKVVDHNPAFAVLSDKLTAKRIARERCPEIAIAKVMWESTHPKSLPRELVRDNNVAIKCNHASGTNVFVSNGKPQLGEILGQAERWIATAWDTVHGEWGYREIPRKIFVEEMLQLGGGDLPTDIKVHVFGGRIGHAWAADKHNGRSRTYDADASPLSVRDSSYPREEQSLPDCTETRGLVRRAIELAPRLAGELDYVRVDFMVADDGLYFGEYTLYPDAGYDRFDEALTRRAETLWNLRCSDFLRRQHHGAARLYAEALCAVIDQGNSWKAAPAFRDSRPSSST